MSSPPRRRSPAVVTILGVDPGTLSTGFGLVQGFGDRIKLVTSGVIRNNGAAPLPSRLQHIYDDLNDVITRYHPDEFAIESAFYGRNAQSSLKLGHARGVSILVAVQQKIPVAEYSPREVKRAVVGNGTASKEQVRFMVKSILDVSERSMILDTSDALAVALCHMHRLSAPRRQPARTWKSFLAAHPERIRR